MVGFYKDYYNIVPKPVELSEALSIMYPIAAANINRRALIKTSG